MGIDFTIRGKPMHLTKEQVIELLKGVEPSSIQAHMVEIEGVQFPVKKAFAHVTGLDLLEFQTAEARRVFERLGFKVSRRK
ncbi:MAG TPA: hypothetical protein VGC66_19105 [Pyrinomonadaceae bacterium]